MPTINKIKRKKRIRYNKFKYEQEHQQFYRLNKDNRDLYFSEHPLDELMLLEGKVVPAECVHHIYPISQEKDYDSKVFITTNPDNFISLSNDTHIKVHNNYKDLTKQQQDYLSNKYKYVEAQLNLHKYNNKIEYR